MDAGRSRRESLRRRETASSFGSERRTDAVFLASLLRGSSQNKFSLLLSAISYRQSDSRYRVGYRGRSGEEEGSPSLQAPISLFGLPPDLCEMSKDQRPTEHQEWRDSLPYKNDDPTCVPKHSAECHCGAVRYAASSDPVSAIMCHCTTCQVRSLRPYRGPVADVASQVVHGAPMQWAVIMKKDTLRFEPESLDQLEFYNTHDKARLQRIRGGKELIVSQIPGRTQPCKVSCRRCGSLIADEGTSFSSR